ncbi:diphthine--ammonia ligase isoform X3 [Pelodiscus sinensis]|uniref:diphthine--ammonia ligase isoform X3 n=1 Tax=Pelodiscus sinensis TaxID=13735 RepID=UPI003F6A72B6
MRVVALISGGKDSCYNMMQCVAAGHQIVALANLRPPENTGRQQGEGSPRWHSRPSFSISMLAVWGGEKQPACFLRPRTWRSAAGTPATDELDSYMYQTVGHHAIDLYAEAMDLPLYRHTIKGTSVDTGRVYTICEGDEVEDLYHLLKLVKDKEAVEGVSVGAILSDYQRVRVENVCKRLNLQSLAYLWRRNQEVLLKEMISSHIQAIIIKVAAFGLDPDKHLGKTLDQMEPYLLELSKKYEVHVCGEGGEYETFTLDCPLFKKKIVVDSSKVVVHSADAFAPVAYLRFLQLHLEDKVESSDKFMISSCCCKVNCAEDSIQSASEEDGPKKSPPIIWKSLEHNSLQYSKPLENSGKSLSGYQWVSGIAARFLQLEERSIQEAAQEAFSSLQANMNTKGLELKDIILVHLYMKNMKDFAVINSAYMTIFDLCPPARVCVEAPLVDGVLFSMDCLAHKCDVTVGDVRSYQKQIMHVQSISHWAPANIGPYSQSIKAEDPEMYSDLAAVYGMLTVVVVPCLPKDALIEWHVIAAVDNPPERRTFVMKMSTEDCQIECEAVESSSACSASISVRLSLISPSASSANLDRTLHNMVAVFRQAVKKLSEDCNAIPLCFRTFYKEDSFGAETLQAGLQYYLEEQLGEKTPALILVPVMDLPEKEVIHIACWLS